MENKSATLNTANHADSRLCVRGARLTRHLLYRKHVNLGCDTDDNDR